MERVNVVFLLIVAGIKITTVNCYDNWGDNDPGIFQPKPSFFKYDPKIGDCFEIYNNAKEVNPFVCTKPLNKDRVACVLEMKNKIGKQCLVLKTPTNEIIDLFCGVTDWWNRKDDQRCFDVYRYDAGILGEACQKFFGENNGTGITTPDGFNILLESDYCDPILSISDLKFSNNFTFDPEVKSCYKVYEPDQDISPFTCLSKDVQDVCAYQWSLGPSCTAITTRNNETIVLGCSGAQNNYTRCYTVYNSDMSVSQICQEKLEERCVGIKTPSNHRVLFECSKCSIPNVKVVGYNPTTQKEYTKFIRKYLENEYQGKNIHFNRSRYDVLTKDDFLQPTNCPNNINRSYTYWLPGTNCFGLTLQSNEIVVLQCIDSSNTIAPKPGFFNILGVNNNVEATVGINVIENRCVGLTTPKNLSVVLDCHPEYACVREEQEVYAMVPDNGLFTRVDTCYKVCQAEDELEKLSYKKCNYSCVDWIPTRPLCLGFTTPANETIQLGCTNITQKEDTFSLLNNFKIDNCVTVINLEDEQEVCIKKLEIDATGLITPKKFTVLLSVKKSRFLLEDDANFLKDYTFDPELRSCFKIFTPDQKSLINNYHCLNKTIYQSCQDWINEKNCTGIVTQNNETIILSCPYVNATTSNTRCFQLYTGQNNKTTVCQEDLTDNCVGIKTPSNLTVMLECRSCESTNGKGYSILTNNKDLRKKYRKFILDTLQSIRSNHYSFLNQMYLAISPTKGGVPEHCHQGGVVYKLHLLPDHNNCWGITTDNLETIVLECPGKNPQVAGCFDVYVPNYGPNMKIQAWWPQQVNIVG